MKARSKVVQTMTGRKVLCERCQAEMSEGERGDCPPEFSYDKGIFGVGGIERHVGPIIADFLLILWGRRNKVVSGDTLIRRVWGATPPEAKNTARNYIYELRKILAGSRYEIVGYPYRGWMLRVREAERRPDNVRPERRRERAA